MSANENQGDGRKVNLPGVYENPDGLQIQTSSGSRGQIQADALVQQMFKRVGDKPSTAKTETKK